MKEQEAMIRTTYRPNIQLVVHGRLTGDIARIVHDPHHEVILVFVKVLIHPPRGSRDRRTHDGEVDGKWANDRVE
jgi:hypothetical protein